MQANRETEELLMAIVKNDVKLVYKKVCICVYVTANTSTHIVFSSHVSCVDIVLCFARALLKRSKILVMDECTVRS